MDGLDTEYFRKNLLKLARDTEQHTPKEMETALMRLADVARNQKREEFNSGDMLAGEPPCG